MKKFSFILVFFLLFAIVEQGFGGTAQKINVYKPEDNKWRSKLMVWPERKIDLKSLRAPKGKDFFMIEYGRPCTFDKDWIKSEGYINKGTYKIENGDLILTGGKKGFEFGFGSKNNHRDNPGIGFGIDWGKARKDNLLLIMEIEQNVPKTQWMFTACRQPNKGVSPIRKKFSITGKKFQKVEVDLGWLRLLVNNPADGISLACLTPNAKVKIKSIVFRPYTACSYWRKKFYLPEKPIFAKASYQVFEDYDLYINGKKVDEGTQVYPGGIHKSLDITPYLKKGENLITMRNDFIGWGRWPLVPKWLFECIAFDRKGRITKIIGDKNWKVSVKAGCDFYKPSYDDRSWKNPRLTGRLPYFFETYTNKPGEYIFTGMNPAHMGLLQPKPNTSKYPVFGYDKDVKYTLKLPVELPAKQLPTLEVLSYPTGKKISVIIAPEPEKNADWKIYKFNLKKLTPGPYNLKWTLKDDRKVIETNITECVVAGPIKQKAFTLDKIESAFEKQLELIKKIDCTRKVTDGSKFVDHSGMYRPAALNTGRVYKSENLKYRETGEHRYDYFAYAADFKAYKGPVLVEVIVPDDKNRLIFCSVFEQYPLRFTNNLPNKRTGFCAATATAITGLDKPLSGKTKKIRFLYYPGSSIASISIMNGFTGSRAAACEINIYKIKGSIPQVKAGSNGRSIGPFTERPSNTTDTFGAQYNAMWSDLRARNNAMKNSWCMSYLIYADKIRFLRFNGQNFTAEGVYMYDGADYASTKHNSYCRSNKDFDALSLALRMYKYNDIKAQLAFQYMSSPAALNDAPQISDRRMVEGQKSSRFVDRYGRQAYARCGATWSFLDPKASDFMLDTLEEIYDLYKDCPAVAGFFLMSGYQTSPGFTTGTLRDVNDYEIGYGDVTVNAFEKKSGINLGITNSDPKRFEKRYKVLTSKYADTWKKWRADILTEYIRKMQKTTPKWPYYVYPYQLNRETKGNPFTEYTGNTKTRNEYLNRRLADGGYDPVKYAKNCDINLINKVLYFNHFRSDKERYEYLYAWNNCPAMLKLCELSKVLFWASTKSFFIEIDQPAKGAPDWILKETKRGVYMPRPIGDNMMAALVDILAKIEPNIIYTMWLDCNFDTNINPALRRFSVEFRAIPQGKYINYDGFTNGNPRIAKVNGKDILRLTNNTPYEVAGTLKVNAEKVYHLACYRELKPIGKGIYKLKLHPQELLTLELSEVSGGISGRLELPENAAKNVEGLAQMLILNPALKNKVPVKYFEQIKQFLNAKDYFSLFVLLKDYEMVNLQKMTRRLKKAMDNQRVLLNQLEQGTARIICASDRNYVDPAGQLWLKDQLYTGEGAYGNLNANFCDRGNIQIKNTDLDRVYQTEAYGGHVYYKIPLPNGKYTIKLHFAETYYKNNGPGRRLFSVRIQGRRLRKKIDPYSMAGGFATAFVIERKNVKVTDGLLTIEFLGGVVINGIEIVKEDK